MSVDKYLKKFVGGLLVLRGFLSWILTILIVNDSAEHVDIRVDFDSLE